MLQCNLTKPLLYVMRNILCLLTGRKDRLELLNSRFAITQCDYLLKYVLAHVGLHVRHDVLCN